MCFILQNVKSAGSDKLRVKCKNWQKIPLVIDLIVINSISMESLLNFAWVSGYKNPFLDMFPKKPDHNLVWWLGAELFWLCSLNNCTQTGNIHAKQYMSPNAQMNFL